jgi:diguanylate cyclase (GGDEF)-like protein
MVEDSPLFGGVFRKQLARMLDAVIDLAVSMAEAGDMVAQGRDQYDAAILDFNLPDAPNGEIVPFMVKKNIPVIVFTGHVTDEVRQFVWKYKVVDYVIKSNASALDYLASLLIRLYKNRDVRVVVADDSAFFRKVIVDLLKVHQLQVLTAGNGREALILVQNNPAIKMVITDYNMPEMDGMELTQKLRQKFSRNKLAIIGISSEGDAVMAARFIKNGANDFIIKQSFLPEEFYCRVNQNLDALDYVHEIQEAAIRDYLTGLYNRRYFFRAGKQFIDAAQRENQSVACAMLDIDCFKKVNDTYGHHAGDLVLQEVSKIMTQQLCDSCLLARMGGEEFCILFPVEDKQVGEQFFTSLCETIASTTIDIGGEHKPLCVTVSIGVVIAVSGVLDELVRDADLNLYEAKEQGRNRVIFS